FEAASGVELHVDSTRIDKIIKYFPGASFLFVWLTLIVLTLQGKVNTISYFSVLAQHNCSCRANG
ncbi:MAG: hypothetical protein ACI9C4_003285, partial [Paraglaciecola sp.]